jgi:micrococcal nuclease
MENRILNTLLSLLIMTSVAISGCSGSVGGNSSKTAVENKSEQKVDETVDSSAISSSTDSSLSQNSVNDNKNLLPATITKNIDGDTLDINLNGKEEKVRMLCVDTPETHHPRLGVQPFGPEAAEYTKKILPVGTKVEIETGIGGGRDKYGRLLAYIYVDGKMFNEMLLEKGLARVAYIYAPNTKYVDEFYAIQKIAQKKGIGIWSIENYAKEDGYHPEATKEKSLSSGTTSKTSTGSSSVNNFQNNSSNDLEANVSCKGKIKGNANSHIYHVPGGAYYDSVKDNIVWFCTEKEAIDAGYRGSKK